MKEILNNPSFKWTLRLINFSLLCFIGALIYFVNPILIYLFTIIVTFATPIIIALVFAMATYPLIQFFRSCKWWPSSIAKITAITLVLLSLVSFFAILIPLLINLTQQSFPQLESIFKHMILPFFNRFGLKVDDLLKYVNVSSIVGSIASVGSNFIWVVIIYLFIVFDIEKIRILMKTLILNTNKKRLISFFVLFDNNFNNYIRGLVNYGGVAIIYYGLSMLLLSLPWTYHNIFAFPWYMLGPLFGVLVIIPYAGPIVGTIMASLAMINFGTPAAITMLVGLIVANQVDANLIQLKIIGSKLRLSAIIIIISLLLISALFGFAGIMLTPLLLVLIKSLIEVFGPDLDTITTIKNKSHEGFIREEKEALKKK